MPCYDKYGDYIPKTWGTMTRWERKNFYRDNERLIALGKKPKPKP